MHGVGHVLLPNGGTQSFGSGQSQHRNGSGVTVGVGLIWPVGVRVAIGGTANRNVSGVLVVVGVAVAPPGVTVGVEVLVIVGVRVGVDVDVLVSVKVGVGEPGVNVAVGEPGVKLGVGVGVRVRVGVTEGEAVGEVTIGGTANRNESGVPVGDWVTVGVKVGVGVGVLVRVLVGVWLAVKLGVDVRVCVGVGVGVGVRVGPVGVGVCVAAATIRAPLTGVQPPGVSSIRQPPSGVAGQAFSSHASGELPARVPLKVRLASTTLVPVSAPGTQAMPMHSLPAVPLLQMNEHPAELTGAPTVQRVLATIDEE